MDGRRLRSDPAEASGILILPLASRRRVRSFRGARSSKKKPLLKRKASRLPRRPYGGWAVVPHPYCRCRAAVDFGRDTRFGDSIHRTFIPTLPLIRLGEHE